jgi:flagellar M-ring protein FliF
MNDSLNRFLEFARSLPLSKKIGAAFTLALLMAGLTVLFVWTNQVDYQVLFNNLSPDDAGEIISELKEKNIPYRIEGNGSTILAEKERIYDLRLTLASKNLPSGGSVGFEIFDKTGFGVTKFVQELNYRRALQGELERTINQFKEVKSSSVFIVLPKESLFVEESKPASASIQLDLKTNLANRKLSSIIHLVASAVEGLEPGAVTVVDTNGRIMFKGGNADYASSFLSSTQLEYKSALENEIRKSVQSMLEGIVGTGKAIVRVIAEIDFNKTTLSEEEYDPASAVVRSRRNLVESSQKDGGSTQTAQTVTNNRKGIVSPQGGPRNINRKEDTTTNYEINKITKSTLQPAGKIKRLSVAAVIDQMYRLEKLEDGTIKKNYIPWKDGELKKFTDIVKNAMGYSEDREDQVSLSSMPFFSEVSATLMAEGEKKGFDILEIIGSYKKLIVNLFLVILIFLFVIRPLLKSLRAAPEKAVLAGAELPGVQIGGEAFPQIPVPRVIGEKEKAIELSNNNPDRAEQILKEWISEPE